MIEIKAQIKDDECFYGKRPLRWREQQAVGKLFKRKSGEPTRNKERKVNRHGLDILQRPYRKVRRENLG